MEKNLCFGIEPIDKEMEELSSKDKLLLESDSTKLSTILCLHFAKQGLDNSEKCLYITDKIANRIIYYGDYIGYNFQKKISDESMILLEYPEEAPSLIKNPDNITLITEDLNVYINEFAPDRIIFDSINPLLPKSLTKEYTNSFYRILYFLRQLKAKIFINFHKTEYRIRQELINMSSHQFFIYPHKWQLDKKDYEFELKYISLEKKETSFRKLFKVKQNIGIIENTTLQNTDFNINYSNIGVIFFPEHYPQLGTYLKRSFNEVSSVHAYSNGAHLIDIIQSSTQGIILIDELVNGVSGYAVAEDIRKFNQKLKLILITTEAIHSSNKFRAIRVGFNGFLYFPLKEKNVLNMMNEILQKDNQFENVTKLKLIFKQDKISTFNKKQYLSLNEIIAFLREYSKEVIEKKSSFCFVILTVSTSLTSFFNQELMNNTNTEIILNFYSLNYTKIVVILKNYDRSKDVESYIEDIYSKNYKENIDESIVAKSTFTMEIPSHFFVDEKNGVRNKNKWMSNFSMTAVNYPFEELDIDVIIKKLMEL